jgi:hypothetical protein
MKKILLTALAILAFQMTTAPVQAAEAPQTRPGDCHWIDVTNVFAFSGEPIDVEMGEQNTFPGYRCTPHRIRVYKAFANTRAEADELRVFAASNDKVLYRMAYCRTSPTQAHIVDFMYFYDFTIKWDDIRRVEKERYSTWLSRYADRRGCRIY